MLEPVTRRVLRSSNQITQLPESSAQDEIESSFDPYGCLFSWAVSGENEREDRFRVVEMLQKMGVVMREGEIYVSKKINPTQMRLLSKVNLNDLPLPLVFDKANKVDRLNGVDRQKMACVALNDWVEQAQSKQQKRCRRFVADKLVKAGVVVNKNGFVIDGNLKLTKLKSVKELPDNLHVTGCLTLKKVGIEKLPAGLEVGASLIVGECELLTEIPHALSVGGKLAINNSANLHLIAEGTKAGSLTIDRNRKLERLPNPMFVTGDLVLNNCHRLDCLPELESGVLDSFELQSCPLIKSIPTSYLSTRFCLSIRDCHGIESICLDESDLHNLIIDQCDNLRFIGKKLTLSGYLRASRCPKLSYLCDELDVHGFLKIYGCSGLRFIASSLKVKRRVDIDHCPKITTLADHVQLGKDLLLDRCHSITHLPDSLRVPDELKFFNCRGLISLAGNFQVGGSLIIENCPNFLRIDNNLRVSGDIHVRYCNHFTGLPPGFKTRGSFRINRCQRFSELPEGLRVGIDLSVNHSPEFSVFPRDLSVRSNISLEGCTGLTSLPSTVTELGPITFPDRRRNRIRQVNLSGTGLSRAIVNQLQQTGPRGMRFIISMPASQHQKYRTLTQVINSWELGKLSLGTAQWSLSLHDESNLITFLSRLHNTADAKNKKTNEQLTRRVASMLRHMSANHSGFREEALAVISHALTSCDDRIISTMNEIEIGVRIREAQQSDNPRQALRKLGVSLFALEQVRSHANVLADRPGFQDPIEVHLALEIGLRDAFKLPVSTQTMLFRRCANFSRRDIEQVRVAVSNAMRTDAPQRFLATWGPWKNLQRRESVTQVKASDLATKTLEQVGLTTESRCLLTLETYHELSEEKKPVVALRTGGSHQLVCLTSLLKAWESNGKHVITNNQIELDDYLAQVVSLIS